jgi:hypothetical protein
MDVDQHSYNGQHVTTVRGDDVSRGSHVSHQSNHTNTSNRSHKMTSSNTKSYWPQSTTNDVNHPSSSAGSSSRMSSGSPQLKSFDHHSSKSSGDNRSSKSSGVSSAVSERKPAAKRPSEVTVNTRANASPPKKVQGESGATISTCASPTVSELASFASPVDGSKHTNAPHFFSPNQNMPRFSPLQLMKTNEHPLSSSPTPRCKPRRSPRGKKSPRKQSKLQKEPPPAPAGSQQNPIPLDNIGKRKED